MSMQQTCESLSDRIIKVFSAFDTSGKGEIDCELLVCLLLKLKSSLTRPDVHALLSELKIPQSGPISYELFVTSLFGGNSSEYHSGCPSTSVRSEDSLSKRCRDDATFGEVFVHGSGDCDQLGLGELHRERQKPTPVLGLSGVRVVSIVCGGLHTICKSAEGQLYSFGCGDDGALGRPPQESDCEPGRISLPEGVQASHVSCGDSHSCMLDSKGRMWQWGSYKDSSGFIGIASSKGILEKSFTPILVDGLSEATAVSSGANHTVVLCSNKRAFCWGSNQSSQLGLPSGAGCEFALVEVGAAAACKVLLINREGSGVVAMQEDPSLPAQRILRLRTEDNEELDATEMCAAEISNCIANGCSMLTCASRTVPLEEKQSLLLPQTMSLANPSMTMRHVFAAAETSFAVDACGTAHGCGLNCNGQAGVGNTSTVTFTLQPIHGINDAEWIGGGLHMSAALVSGRVFTWGRAAECGHGLSSNAPAVTTPQLLHALPSRVSSLRCGMAHTLACSHDGQVYTWGCGIMHQLGNRPRDFERPSDAHEEPEDEATPYCMSAKKLAGRKVLMADGGAQHSVELVLMDSSHAPATNIEEEHQSDFTSTGANAGARDNWPAREDDHQSEEDGEPVIVTTSEDFWRVQIEAVYRRRNPHKLGNVPNLLQKYKDREAILYAKVCKTYDLNPLKLYADPLAWVEEDTDVKDDNSSNSAVQEDGPKVGASLFGGLLAPAVSQEPEASALFGGVAEGTCSLQGPALPASSGTSLFKFGESAAQSTDRQPDEASHSSSEDESRTRDKRDSKRKRQRVIKSSAFTKVSPKEKRKHR